DLLLDSVRSLAEREARRHGLPETAYATWLQRLACGLELRGRTQASAAELAAVAGPNAGDPTTVRERLVRATLLRDLPDEVAFPEQTIQEALCAAALLATNDVAAAVADLCTRTLDGELVLRDDMDHCLDLVWENGTAA